MEKEYNDFDESRIDPDILAQIENKWKDIGIDDDFIFCKVMQDEELLSELIHRIIPELNFVALQVHSQHVVEIGKDIHGVRFDIYAILESGDIADIEMQVNNTGNLPKRLRYYTSICDIEMLEKGRLYEKLPPTYIIMICQFDLFEKGLHKYTFNNRCIEAPEIELEDEVTKIVLNTKGTANDVDSELLAFLDYVAGKTVDDEYISRVDQAVARLKMNKERRVEYMMMTMREWDKHEEGRREGRMEGYESGIRAMVSLCKKTGANEIDVIETVVADMDMSEETARELVEKYW